MKTYISHRLIGCATLLALSACGDYLDVDPESVFTEQNVGNQEENGPKYTTKQDMDMLQGGIYSGFKGALSNIYNLDLLMLSEARSDNAYAGSIEGWALELDNFNVNPNNAVTARGWGQYFQMIGQANLIIDNVDTITDPAMTAEHGPLPAAGTRRNPFSKSPIPPMPPIGDGACSWEPTGARSARLRTIWKPLSTASTI